MSIVSIEDQATLQEICVLFTEAERAIKEVEDTGGELIVPAVNQLRYTGNHLIRYLSDPAVEAARYELADAIKHCKRATYDAYEAAILHQLMELKKFKDDYRKTQITTIIPLISLLFPQRRRGPGNSPVTTIKAKPGASSTMPPKITCISS